MTREVEIALARDLTDPTSVRLGIEKLLDIIQRDDEDGAAATASLEELITSVGEDLQPSKTVAERASARVNEMVTTLEGGNPSLMVRPTPSSGTALPEKDIKRIGSAADALWSILQRVPQHISDAALDQVIALKDYSTWGQDGGMVNFTWARQRHVASLERDRRRT